MILFACYVIWACNVTCLVKACMISCLKENIFDAQDDTYFSDALSYAPCHIAHWWLVSKRKWCMTSWIKKNSFSDATGHTCFSDTTSHTSPSGYVGRWWPQLPLFCKISCDSKKWIDKNDQQWLECNRLSFLRTEWYSILYLTFRIITFLTYRHYRYYITA